MSGVNKFLRRSYNFGTFQGFKTSGEAKREKHAKAQNALDKVYAGAEVPDAEQLKRVERKKMAKRQGSRANTVLTNNDQLG